jgi:hypothetical protein
MSRSHRISVRLPLDDDLAPLLRDIEAAHRRAVKSEPGERGEIARYEALCTVLEALAGAQVSRGAQVLDPPDSTRELTGGSFLRDEPNGIVVPLVLPLELGVRAFADGADPALPPATAVPIREDLRGRRLVQARFEEQLDTALQHPGETRRSTLSPSGVHNRVLTEVLRKYVNREGRSPVAVPVVYRDGSSASAPFTFRSLDLADHLSDLGASDISLRFTLLSIRHTEMDPVVDGAWLRNAEVSRPRPAAQTDDFVYQRSVEQLDVLTQRGSRKARLHIFQTGLETAVVGFFRAVVEFLVAHPGRLEVVPMFYAANSSRTARSSVDEEIAGFEPGRPWATVS